VVGESTDVVGAPLELSGLRASCGSDALDETVVLGCGGLTATGSSPRVPSSEDTTTVRPCGRREVDSMFWMVGPVGVVVELEFGVGLGAELVVTLAFASAVDKDSALTATVEATS